jgi:hypothetical protein
MIGRCERCGGFIAVMFRKEDGEYTCHKRSCIRIGKAEVDLIAERAVKAYVKRKDVYEQFANGPEMATPCERSARKSPTFAKNTTNLATRSAGARCLRCWHRAQSRASWHD